MLSAAKGARCGQMTHKFLSLPHLAGRRRLPPTGSPCLQLPALRPPLSMSIYPQILLRNRNSFYGAGCQRALDHRSRCEMPENFTADAFSAREREPSFYQGLSGPSLRSALQGGIAYPWGLRPGGRESILRSPFCNLHSPIIPSPPHPPCPPLSPTARRCRVHNACSAPKLTLISEHENTKV